MSSSTKNVKLGVCQVFYDGVDLGLTQGGVEFMVTTETYRVEVDQFGKTAINELIQGRKASAKVPMAETTLQNLMAIMPGSTLVTDGANASATVTIATQPTATTTVTIGGQAFSFQAGKPTTAYQVQIGANLAESIQNFIDTVNRSGIQAAIGGIKASLQSATVVKISAIDPGTAGNAVTLAAANGATASGANLTGGVNETKARVEVSTGVGVDLLDIARSLRLHPVSKAAQDFSEDLVIYKAATPGALQFAYKVDAERVYNAEFEAYPDPVTGKLFALGNPWA